MSVRIAGGFVLVPVSELMHAWRACRSRPLGIGDFRTWLACREMVARRCLASESREVRYGTAELAKLLGVTSKRARASVRRLGAIGLLVWSGSTIEFPDQVDRNVELVVDTIGRGRGSVAIPRRLLRMLAAGARPALVATALGILLRCLSRRKGGFAGRGRVKASWIASVFGVDERRVKAARRELVGYGWIAPEPSSQRAENRWGRAFRIDLAWRRPDTDGPSLPPLPVLDRREFATPSVDPEPLPERAKNQEPAGRGPTGLWIEGQGGETPSLVRDAQMMLSAPQASPKECSATPKPLPAPTLDDVRVEDLRDVTRLIELHRQAMDRQLVSTSEADRLRFVGAARHALAIGKGNTPGLFVHLIRGACWQYLTTDDEDQARRLLHQHDHGGRTAVDRAMLSAFTPSMRFEPWLSKDARIVKAIREASIRAGIYRDPWPAFSARSPGWTRARWDAALGELGLGQKVDPVLETLVRPRACEIPRVSP